MSTVALDVAAVRARFSALDRPTAFFDGPGGTQAPDSVIDAVASYLREANANLGGPFETSRRSDAVVRAAHEAAARFLGCMPGGTGFGAGGPHMRSEADSGDSLAAHRPQHLDRLLHRSRSVIDRRKKVGV